MDWTFVRPGTFATNTVAWWARTIREQGVVRLPYPGALSAPVHERDIAALGVAALTEPGHSHQAYTLFGPESLTLRRQVECIGEALGRTVRVEHVSPEDAVAELTGIWPEFIARALVGQWAAAVDRPALTSGIVEKITGLPARTYAAWALDHAADFR